MAIKIGINGFGRIGRMVFRAAVKNFSQDIEIVGINDLLDPDYLAYMLKYDSVHGQFQGEISVDGTNLIVNGKKIRLTAEKDPATLKWNEVGADIVVESTGLFLTKEICRSPHQSGCEESDHVGTFKGRHPNVRLWRERQELCRTGDHLECLLYHKLFGTCR